MKLATLSAAFLLLPKDPCLAFSAYRTVWQRRSWLLHPFLKKKVEAVTILMFKGNVLASIPRSILW